MGDRIPVPDGVECPRPHRNVPGRRCVLETKTHGTSADDAGVHKGDCLATESPCCGVREGTPAPVGMMGDASPWHLLPERLCPCRGGRGWEEARAVSKLKGRRAEVRKGKVTARKVNEVLTAVARLIRAVGVLVDALSKWIG